MAKGNSLTIQNDGLSKEELAVLEEVLLDDLSHQVDNTEVKPPILSVDAGRITMPPDATHPEEWLTKEVEVVILHRLSVRSYYDKPREIGAPPEPPTCASNNYVTPDSNIEAPQASSCATCPKNEWGSDRPRPDGSPSRGKACKEKRRLFVVVEGGALPYVLHVSPTSLRSFDAYAQAMKQARLPLIAVKTKIRATEIDKTYTVLSFEQSGRLQASEIKSLISVAETIKKSQQRFEEPF